MASALVHVLDELASRQQREAGGEPVSDLAARFPVEVVRLDLVVRGGVHAGPCAEPGLEPVHGIEEEVQAGSAAGELQARPGVPRRLETQARLDERRQNPAGLEVHGQADPPAEREVRPRPQERDRCIGGESETEIQSKDGTSRQKREKHAHAEPSIPEHHAASVPIEEYTIIRGCAHLFRPYNPGLRTVLTAPPSRPR